MFPIPPHLLNTHYQLYITHFYLNTCCIFLNVFAHVAKDLSSNHLHLLKSCQKHMAKLTYNFLLEIAPHQFN